LPGQAISGRGGGKTDATGPYPRLPAALRKAPDWIGSDAPYDVTRFFAPVLHDRNAAPLYLDALFEFGSEMAVCFPEGPERDRRRQAAEDRMRRYVVLSESLTKDPKAVPAESIDAVIRSYDTGFRKLAEAQRRDRCVFEIGVGPDAILCHVQAARQVARIASLRVRRAVERRDFDAAIREVEAVLRLARDLRPRGYIINQLCAVAITQVVCADITNAILAGPGLRVEHCDRLLKVLFDHEASSGDGYAEGLRAEYVFSRSSIRDLERKHPQLVEEDWPARSARLVRDMNDFYRKLLDLDGVPFVGRLEKIATLKLAKDGDPLSGMVDMLLPSVLTFAQAMGRVAATLRATECLIVMRRWHLTHRGYPRALTVAVREAGLKDIPTDPFDGKPMRVGVFEGQTVVYSVGKDGRDDGGQTDSKFDTRPGDLIYRVPSVE
jgi:hypothetical protein